MKLYGRRSVVERLKVSPHTIQRIFFREDSNLSDVLQMAKSAKKPCLFLPKHQFDKTARGFHAQGVIAEARDYEYVSLEDVLDSSNIKKPTLLFLDRITDPQNLGAIIRSAACFGDFALVLSKNETCEVTEAALRVASGGENYVSISRVVNLSKSLDMVKEYGYWVVATVVAGGENIFSARLQYPLCLVIGSEAKGIRSGLIKNIDMRLTLPMYGAKLSFNVAVACSLFCYEATRQRKSNS